MKTYVPVTVSAAIETATGIALIAVPLVAAHWLLGTSLDAAGIAVARVGGMGLLSLGIACWSSRDGALPNATRALFIYNLLAALYLGYLRVGGGFDGILLWPACVLHAVLTILLARPAFDTARRGIPR